MVDWLAGKRIKGTSTERTASFIPSVGGWKELGRTTLGSGNSVVNVGSLANKRYLMFLSNDMRSIGNTDGKIRLNSDTGSNYSTRGSSNGSADATGVNQTGGFYSIDTGADENFTVGYCANYATKEKLLQYWRVNKNSAGAGYAPYRREFITKHAQTSNPVTDLQIFTGGSDTYNTGSELVVLGWDPADTHTNNFWTELSNVTLGADGDTLSSGTITAKKYLWGQAFIRTKTGTTTTDIRFNGDTGSNYSKRKSFAGGAEELSNSENRINVGGIDSDNPSFINFFIINNSANEKLVMFHSVFSTPTGAGTAPYRIEGVGKWANTSNQITEINFVNTGAGDYELGSKLIIWGSN